MEIQRQIKMTHVSRCEKMELDGLTLKTYDSFVRLTGRSSRACRRISRPSICTARSRKRIPSCCCTFLRIAGKWKQCLLVSHKNQIYNTLEILNSKLFCVTNRILHRYSDSAWNQVLPLCISHPSRCTSSALILETQPCTLLATYR